MQNVQYAIQQMPESYESLMTYFSKQNEERKEKYMGGKVLFLSFKKPWSMFKNILWGHTKKKKKKSNWKKNSACLSEEHICSSRVNVLSIEKLGNSSHYSPWAKE